MASKAIASAAATSPQVQQQQQLEDEEWWVIGSLIPGLLKSQDSIAGGSMRRS
jgi:hypothetical protein